MSDVDWDSVASDAETTPGTILATIEARLEDVEDVVIVTRFRDGLWRFDYSGHVINAIGLASAGLDFLKRELRIANEVDD